MRGSIVSTLYNSGPHIDEFHRRVVASATEAFGEDFEVVLVNDGSPDDSLAKAIALSEIDERVTVVDLSRNFGHHKAMMAGLAHARGDLVFLIDSDLEEAPELLPAFCRRLQDEDCDVVFGVQQKRRGGLGERVFGGLYYRLVNLVTGLSLAGNLLTVRLMRRAYVEALLRHEEREIVIAGLWHITGFDQRPHVVSKPRANKSNYNLRRKLSILVNTVTSFSKAPLVAIFYLGMLIAIISGAFALFVVLRWFFIGVTTSGWTSLIVSVWLVGGMIISFLGVIGIYIAKIFAETKQRPNYIVRRIYGRQQQESP